MNNQIYSKEFKDWFGDWENDEKNSSKVVDDSGKPLVVYHGTDEEFNVFDKNKTGKNYWQGKDAFFFTDKLNSAKNYAKNSNDNGKVISVYLDIKNPYLENAIDYYGAVDKYDMNAADIVNKAIGKGNDGIIINSSQGSLYVVFYPNQIKSVNNNGQWNKNSNNIYEYRIYLQNRNIIY